MTTPIRTAARDTNLFSLNASSIVWYAGTEGEYEAENLPYPFHLLPEDPKAWDGILKLSGRANTVLLGLKVAQGKESSVDINNTSHHCSLEGRFGVTGEEGEHVIKVKGGSHHIAIKGSVESTGRKASIVLGEWSDQSTASVHHVDLSLLRHHTGRPLTVVLARADRSTIALPPGAKVLWWASICETLYWHLKRAYVAVRYRRW